MRRNIQLQIFFLAGTLIFSGVPRMVLAQEGRVPPHGEGQGLSAGASVAPKPGPGDKSAVSNTGPDKEQPASTPTGAADIEDHHRPAENHSAGDSAGKPPHAESSGKVTTRPEQEKEKESGPVDARIAPPGRRAEHRDFAGDFKKRFRPGTASNSRPRAAAKKTLGSQSRNAIGVSLSGIDESARHDVKPSPGASSPSALPEVSGGGTAPSARTEPTSNTPKSPYSSGSTVAVPPTNAINGTEIGQRHTTTAAVAGRASPAAGINGSTIRHLH
jgi:hypothetical protein